MERFPPLLMPRVILLPWLIRRVISSLKHLDPRLLRNLADDRLLGAFARLHEARDSGIAVLRPLRLSTEQGPIAFFNQNDDGRVRSRVMKDAAGRAQALTHVTALAHFREFTAATTVAMSLVPRDYRLCVREYRGFSRIDTERKGAKVCKILKRLLGALVEVQCEIHRIVLFAEVNPRIDVTETLKRLFSCKPRRQPITFRINSDLHLMNADESCPTIHPSRVEDLGIYS